MSDSANNGNLFHRISVFVVDKISKAKIQANFFNCRSAYISARIRMFLTTLISLIKTGIGFILQQIKEQSP